MNIALTQLYENQGEIKYQSYYLFVMVLFMFIIDIGHTLTTDFKVARFIKKKRDERRQRRQENTKKEPLLASVPEENNESDDGGPNINS